MLKANVEMYESSKMNAKMRQKKHDREIGHIPRHGYNLNDWLRLSI